MDEVGLLDDVWDGFKFFIGFGDEDFVVGVLVSGGEMIWEAALDEGVWVPG